MHIPDNSNVANVSRGNSEARCSKLKEEYTDVRHSYIGETYLVEYDFDVELGDKIISSLKKGKAAGLDGLAAEHLQFCPPVLPLILVKLFNFFMSFGYVPACFGQAILCQYPKAVKQLADR